MAEQSHADAIRQYWTPERIRSAKPKDNDYDASGKKQAGGTDYVKPIEIKNSTRKTFPYQCVGKLVFTQKGENFQGTAYVADTGKGKNIVFTAAHNLYDKDGPVENIMFVPACQSNQKPVPEFGSFTPIPGGMDKAWIVATGWLDKQRPFERYLDMGAIKLGKNEAGKNVGEVVAMLKPAVDLENKYKKGETEWRIIGYHTFEYPGMAKQDIMYETDGAYVESTTIEGEGGMVIVRKNPVMKGMSGGPWLLKNDGGQFAIANGNQSGNDFGASPDPTTMSPYYSNELVVTDIIKRL